MLCVATLPAHSAAGLETEAAAVRFGSEKRHTGRVDKATVCCLLWEGCTATRFSKVLNTSAKPASSVQAEQPLRLCIVLAHAGQKTSEEFSNQSQLPGVATTEK